MDTLTSFARSRVVQKFNKLLKKITKTKKVTNQLDAYVSLAAKHGIHPQ
ncbi:MAG: hypothetical protein AAF340_18425 [Pseudomonadota bacterium]